ncbi:MAG: 30S ribosomal protein S20 [Planctomycetota bacterium]
MAHSVSARKRIRQNEARRIRNKATKSSYRTEIKKVLTLAAKGNLEGAKTEIPNAMKRIDKAAKTRAIHPNAAARYKSRLHRAIARAAKEAAAKTTTKGTVKAARKPSAKSAAKKQTSPS